MPDKNIGVRYPLPGIVYPPADRLRQYIESGALGERSLIEALTDAFDRHSSNRALLTCEGDVTYAELQETTDRFAAALLRLGIEPFGRVLFQVGNCREFVFACLGCLKAGLIPVCTLAAHREREIEYFGRLAGARVHIVQDDDPRFDLVGFALHMKRSIPSLRHVISVRGRSREGVLRFEDMVGGETAANGRRLIGEIQRDPYQAVIFQLSGGTTGLPKIIPRLQNEYLLNAQLTAQVLNFRQPDVIFNPMPMIHNACMVSFWLPTLLTGAAFAIAQDMTPHGWGRMFAAKRPTFLGLIKALLPRLDAMLEGGFASLDGVRACWCPDAARLIRERYGIPTHAVFGMAEGMNLYTRADDPVEAIDGTVGRPISPFDEIRLIVPGTERLAEIGEIGELRARGPYTTCGYYNAPELNQEAFTHDGFYKTGDLLVCREIAGTPYYAFAGRIKDVINRAFEKINCEEIEQVLLTQPSISVCAVIGMPDPVLGERVCVYMVVRENCAAPTLGQLAGHMKAVGLAKFKWPERLEVIGSLPLTKIGKVDKAKLREDLRQRMSAEATRAESSSAQAGAAP
jgi:non-ribosomal peptide synthetase component E (peptide arylation enzyme)